MSRPAPSGLRKSSKSSFAWHDYAHSAQPSRQVSRVRRNGRRCHRNAGGGYGGIRSTAAVRLASHAYRIDGMDAAAGEKRIEELMELATTWRQLSAPMAQWRCRDVGQPRYHASRAAVAGTRGSTDDPHHDLRYRGGRRRLHTPAIIAGGGITARFGSPIRHGVSSLPRSSCSPRPSSSINGIPSDSCTTTIRRRSTCRDRVHCFFRWRPALRAYRRNWAVAPTARRETDAEDRYVARPVKYPAQSSTSCRQEKQGNAMANVSRVRSIELLACDAGWRNYHFVKITTEDGTVGWSEFDESVSGVGAVIQRLSARWSTKYVSTRAHLCRAFRPTRPGRWRHRPGTRRD